MSKEWHGYETATTVVFRPEYYESMGNPLPEPDECHYLNFHGTLCGRKQFMDSNVCFWHFRDVSKYEQEAINDYFGTECTLKEAIENEVRQGRSLRGAYLKKALIGGTLFERGANLAGADLRDADLTDVHLSYGSLSGAKLNGADLEGAYLSDVDLKECDFRGAKLYNAKFRGNDFSGVKGLAKESFWGWKYSIIPQCKMLESYPDQCKDVYRSLTAYFQAAGALDDAGWAAYKEREMHRQWFRTCINPLSHTVEETVSAVFRQRQPGLKIILFSLVRSLVSLIQYFKLTLFKILCGYGERIWRIVVMSLLVIIVYTMVYMHQGVLDGFQSSLYFSFMTFLTMSDANLSINGNYHMLVVSEAFLGVVLMGLLLFTMARKAVGRS